jgi:hypothetical protein
MPHFQARQAEKFSVNHSPASFLNLVEQDLNSFGQENKIKKICVKTIFFKIKKIIFITYTF